MARLLDLIERHLGNGWIDLAEYLRDHNQLADIEARLEEDDIEGVIADIDVAAKQFAAETQAAYDLAGAAEANWLSDELSSPDVPVVVRFDVENWRAVERARSDDLELVRGLAEEQRANVKQILADGVQRGLNPREMAKDIRGSIGLAPIQERAVRSYRRALEDGDWSNALGRELRDARADRSLERLLRDGGQLGEERIDSLVDRYRANYLTHRAEVIARTEGLRSLHQGTEDLFCQAIDRGDVVVGQLVRIWNSAHDRRVRRSHYAMDKQERDFGEPFESGNGVELRYPGDPDADSSEVVNCRCVVSTRFRSAAAARSTEGRKSTLGAPRRTVAAWHRSSATA